MRLLLVVLPLALSLGPVPSALAQDPEPRERSDSEPHHRQWRTYPRIHQYKFGADLGRSWRWSSEPYRWRIRSRAPFRAWSGAPVRVPRMSVRIPRMSMRVPRMSVRMPRMSMELHQGDRWSVGPRWYRTPRFDRSPRGRYQVGPNPGRARFSDRYVTI